MILLVDAASLVGRPDPCGFEGNVEPHRSGGGRPRLARPASAVLACRGDNRRWWGHRIAEAISSDASVLVIAIVVVAHARRVQAQPGCVAGARRACSAPWLLEGDRGYRASSRPFVKGVGEVALQLVEPVELPSDPISTPARCVVMTVPLPADARIAAKAVSILGLLDSSCAQITMLDLSQSSMCRRTARRAPARPAVPLYPARVDPEPWSRRTACVANRSFSDALASTALRPSRRSERLSARDLPHLRAGGPTGPDTRERADHTHQRASRQLAEPVAPGHFD